MAGDDRNTGKEAEIFNNFLFEMLRCQMELSRIWGDVFKQLNPLRPEESQELSKIAGRHWQRVQQKTKELFPENSIIGPDFLKKQKELYFYTVESYSLMIQEFLTDPICLNLLKDGMDSGLSKKMQFDKVRDDTLKSMGLPSRKDMQEIYHSLYMINKKLDKLSEAVLSKGDEDIRR